MKTITASGWMRTLKMSVLAALMSALLLTSGCWLVVGAAGAGAAYEYSSKKQLDSLEADYKAGNITEQEYESRKQQIRDGSIIY